MRQVLFDITRIFIRGSRFSPTGIDRVVVAYAKWLLGQPVVDLQPVLTVGGRLYRTSLASLQRTVNENQAFQQRLSEAEPTPGWDAVRRILAADVDADNGPPLRAQPITRQLPRRVAWHAAIAARAIAHLRPLQPRPGALYINVSHTGLDQSRVLSRLTNVGIAPVIMVHDLIPINFPEYCAPSAEARHRRRMDEITREARLIITNSSTTADEVRNYARNRDRNCPELLVAPLGVESAFQGGAAPPSAKAPYFVCIGTLEARKNAAFVLALWRQLSERLAAATPRLILVGRRGWENESVIDHLQRSKSVIRLAHEVSDLRDTELAQLIAGASALISPSFAEGFDLPVLEAMSLGTPVIASDIPVHRELASHATLVDPLDGPGWLAAIEAALLQPACARAYSPPTWNQHFATLGRALAHDL